MNVSIIKGFTHVSGDVDYDWIEKVIKQGDFKLRQKVDKVRSLLNDYRLWEAETRKKLLPAFTPSATFNNSRTLKTIKDYNSVIHLDYDKVNSIELGKIANAVKDWPYTFMSFISPSGTGLKVFVRTDAWLDNHKLAWEAVNKHYSNLLGIHADEKCKDVTRLCFLTHDPNIYYNPDSNIFNIDN